MGQARNPLPAAFDGLLQAGILPKTCNARPQTAYDTGSTSWSTFCVPPLRPVVTVKWRLLVLVPALVFSDLHALPASAEPDRKETTPPSAAEPVMTLDIFLERLMRAESGGQLFAKNPRSTAVGPFQFIASTWLQVAREAFAEEIKELAPHEILGLRTDLGYARRAAQYYTEHNAAFLVAHDVKATFPNLRLAHLVGAGGAVKILSAHPETKVTKLLGATVIGANPFMASMTASDLIDRAAKNIDTNAMLLATLTPDAKAVDAAKVIKVKARPAIDVDCNLSLPSCRRWLALANRRLSGKRAQR